MASSRGVILVNISQCQQGSVSAAYEAGAVLEAAGVVQGADMTPEAALAKLSYILAIEGLTVDEKRRMLRMNLRGELTQPDMKRLSLSDNNFLTTVAASLRFDSYLFIVQCIIFVGYHQTLRWTKSSNPYFRLLCAQLLNLAI